MLRDMNFTVNCSMNDVLCSEFTETPKHKAALFDMHPTKARRVYGTPFSKKMGRCWEGGHFSAILKFLMIVAMSLGGTLMTLIPKVTDHLLRKVSAGWQ
ncbi:hypothetical protein F511_07217 [Dorcoceras hygrometricum]|uniref:Uncharacterized protein n=1 Tax=Dorcoceras hygrometricum TaxID=472368 RepID=A0A2Z7B1V0_9LAMI|nr:hypothetical protein F511_07217 [Dorcoceras hygrometricum]